MQLLAKINEDGTDLSMETWLDSAFILPFKVVRYCNIYINYYVSKKKSLLYVLFLFFQRAPNFPLINRISAKGCCRNRLSTTEGILLTYFRKYYIFYLCKNTNIVTLLGILCFYNLKMLWIACFGTYKCICSFVT